MSTEALHLYKEADHMGNSLSTLLNCCNTSAKLPFSKQECSGLLKCRRLLPSVLQSSSLDTISLANKASVNTPYILKGKQTGLIQPYQMTI